MKTKMVVVVLFTGLAGFLLGIASRPPQPPQPKGRPTPEKVFVNHPDPQHPSGRGFARLRIVRIAGGPDPALTIEPVPEEPTDRHWIVEVNGVSYTGVRE